MKNLPVHKLLYPALAAAALLSAASVGLYAAYNSYTQCRCSQPSPQSPYNSLTTCCGDSSYASLNQTACCGDATYKTNNPTKCSSPGTAKISSVTGSDIMSVNTYSYGADGTNDCTVTTACTDNVNAFLKNVAPVKCGINPSTGKTWTTGDACDKNTFQTCWLSSQSIAHPSPTVDTGYCFIPGNTLYPCSNSAVGIPCQNGCNSSGSGLWTCWGTTGSAPMTVGAPNMPTKCYRWQCLCYAQANIITCS